MQLKKTLCAAMLGALFVGAPALAQTGQSVCWRQPWTRPSASFESSVLDCADPVPVDRVAMDDFVCDVDATLVRVHWWGAIFDPAQLDRPFYIAIYNDIGCEPGDLVAQWCVQAEWKFQALDCKQDRVFKFSARLPNPFTVIAGDRYWIQISEIDELSANPGAVDFRWSSHRPIRDCPAMQRDAGGTITSPLLDTCDDKEEDLAFVLFHKTIIGTIITPNLGITVYVLQLFPVLPPEGGDPEPMEELIVEPDANGRFDVAPSLPNGEYMWKLQGMSIRPEMGMVMIQDGTESPISGKPVEPDVGDTDSNGVIDVLDLLRLLGGWG